MGHAGAHSWEARPSGIHVFGGTYASCECGATRWEISATLIGCKACGKVWGRVNGQWVEETERQFNILGAKVQDSAPRLTPEGDIVVDRKIQLAKPVDYIPLKFVVPENPLTKDEDFVIPGKSSAPVTDPITDDADLEYVRKNLWAALKKEKP
jgi:hypothetical protein